MPNPPDDEFSVQAGTPEVVVNEDKDGLTTTLSVTKGQVEFAAKGPVVTPTGCANRCKTRVWTAPTNAGSFTEVTDQELTAAATNSDQVLYSLTLKKGSKIRYEGFVDVTLTSSADAKVKRSQTTQKPA